MTSEEIEYVINDIAGYDFAALGHPVPLTGIRYFNENRFVDIGRNRYFFDYENELMVIYFCREREDLTELTIPSDWVLYTNYDVYDGVVYEYLCDPNASEYEPIRDYIDFDSIDTIGIDDEE